MRIVGFNFTKISVEELKKNYKVGELKIKTSIDISEIKEIKSDFLKTKDQVLNIDFSFAVDYNPEVAKVDFKGRLFLSVESKQAKEILKQWKKKKMADEFKRLLFNIILKKSTLKALSLEEELNLPLHMPLPSFKRKE